MKNKRRTRFQNILKEWLESKELPVWFDNKGAASVGHDGHLYIHLGGSIYVAFPVEVKTSRGEEVPLYGPAYEQYKRYLALYNLKKIRTIYALHVMGTNDWVFEFIDNLQPGEAGKPKLIREKMKTIDDILKEVRVLVKVVMEEGKRVSSAEEMDGDKKESKRNYTKKRGSKQGSRSK